MLKKTNGIDLHPCIKGHGRETGMSYELCIVRTRESTEGRKMGGSVGVLGTPVVYRGGWPIDCASFLCAPIPYPHSTTNFNRYMGLRFGPRRGGGGHSAWCAWLAKELDHPLHHACVIFSALDGWEDGGDPVLLVDTSELF